MPHANQNSVLFDIHCLETLISTTSVRMLPENAYVEQSFNDYNHKMKHANHSNDKYFKSKPESQYCTLAPLLTMQTTHTRLLVAITQNTEPTSSQTGRRTRDV